MRYYIMLLENYHFSVTDHLRNIYIFNNLQIDVQQAGCLVLGKHRKKYEPDRTHSMQFSIILLRLVILPCQRN